MVRGKKSMQKDLTDVSVGSDVLLSVLSLLGGVDVETAPRFLNFLASACWLLVAVVASCCMLRMYRKRTGGRKLATQRGLRSINTIADNPHYYTYFMLQANHFSWFGLCTRCSHAYNRVDVDVFFLLCLSLCHVSSPLLTRDFSFASLCAGVGFASSGPCVWMTCGGVSRGTRWTWLWWMSGKTTPPFRSRRSRYCIVFITGYVVWDR